MDGKDRGSCTVDRQPRCLKIRTLNHFNSDFASPNWYTKVRQKMLLRAVCSTKIERISLNGVGKILKKRAKLPSLCPRENAKRY